MCDVPTSVNEVAYSSDVCGLDAHANCSQLAGYRTAILLYVGGQACARVLTQGHRAAAFWRRNTKEAGTDFAKIAPWPKC